MISPPRADGRKGLDARKKNRFAAASMPARDDTQGKQLTHGRPSGLLPPERSALRKPAAKSAAATVPGSSPLPGPERRSTPPNPTPEAIASATVRVVSRPWGVAAGWRLTKATATKPMATANPRGHGRAGRQCSAPTATGTARSQNSGASARPRSSDRGPGGCRAAQRRPSRRRRPEPGIRPLEWSRVPDVRGERGRGEGEGERDRLLSRMSKRGSAPRREPADEVTDAVGHRREQRKDDGHAAGYLGGRRMVTGLCEGSANRLHSHRSG